MKCVICKNGETAAGHATVTLNRGHTVVVVRDVPADVCGNCGEYYLSESVTENVLQRAGQAVEQGVEVGIIGYAA